MQADFLQFLSRQTRSPFSKMADDFDFHTELASLLQNLQHLCVRHLRVVNQQFFLSLAHKFGQLLAGIQRTNHKSAQFWRVRLAVNVSLEKPDGFLNEGPVSRDDSESPAMLEIQSGVIMR